MHKLKKSPQVIQNISMTFSPELFRILTYLSLMILMLIGWILTYFFSNISFHHNPMVDAFGYNNVCVLFDFPPSTLILPMLYPFVLLFWSIYLYSHWLRGRFLIKSNVKFAIFTMVSIIQILAAVVFSIIFAVNPHENLTIHYAGFAVLIFALTLLTLNNFIYFNTLFLDTPLTKILGSGYVVAALIIGTIKIFLAVNFLILGHAWLEPLGYAFVDKLTMIKIYLIIDRAWLALFLIIPFFFSFYLYKKCPQLNFNVTIEGRISGEAQR